MKNTTATLKIYVVHDDGAEQQQETRVTDDQLKEVMSILNPLPSDQKEVEKWMHEGDNHD